MYAEMQSCPTFMDALYLYVLVASYGGQLDLCLVLLLLLLLVDSESNGSTELCRRPGDALYGCYYQAGAQIEGLIREGGGVRFALARTL